MRFETTPAFDADWARLSTDERRMFAAAIRDFSDACDRFIADPAQRWPNELRVKKIRSARGIFEMTWSFAGPDGRATWEWVEVSVGDERHPAVRWRRIGGHRIFDQP